RGPVEAGGPGLLHDLLALGQGRVVLVPGRRGAAVAGARGAGGPLVAPGRRPEGEGQRGWGGPAGDVDAVRGVIAPLEVGARPVEGGVPAHRVVAELWGVVAPRWAR